MKRTIKICCCGIGAAAVLSGGVYLFRNQIIASAIETVVPKITQTAVAVGAVDFNPFAGRAEIKALTLGNPAGYGGDMLKLADIRVTLDPTTVLSDKIVIHDIFIDGVSVNYAVSAHGVSNIAVLQQNVAGDAKPRANKTAKPADKTPKPEKQVVIDKFTLQNAEVSASFAGIGATLPLPDIHITDIGKQQNKSVKEAFADILSVFSKETLTAVQNAAQDTFKSGAKSLNKLLKKLF